MRSIALNPRRILTLCVLTPVAIGVVWMLAG